MTLEIRETAAGSYGRKQPANTEETAAFIHCYGTCLAQTGVQTSGVPESNCKFICYAIPIPFLFVYLIDPEARTNTV